MTRAKAAACVLSLGVIIALLAGWLHTAEVAVPNLLLSRFAWVSRDFAWMAPLAYALVLLPPAAVLCGVAAVVPSPGVVGLCGGLLATAASFGLLLPLTIISRTSALLLALGVGVQVGALVMRRAAALSRLAPRVALAMSLVAGTLAVGLPAWRSWQSTRVVASLPAPAVNAPNVLLVVLDAARARSLGFIHPSAGTTPRLDRWATSGAVFSNAFSVGPWTLPSHASMMSGRYASELEADWTVPIERTHPVLPELLATRGYATAAFVANLHYTAWDSGLGRGFASIDDYQADPWQTIRSSSFGQTNLADTLLRVPALATLGAILHPDLSIIRQHRYQSRLGTDVIDAFLAWRRPAGRPWFALLNLMDPHLVTSAPDRTRRRYPHDPRGEDDYLAAMRYLDGEIDRLLTSLAREGTLDRTLVVVTADHGELLGEHGLHGHAQSLYRDVVHVPLFLRLPGVVPARREARPVSLRDLAATIVDITGGDGASLPGTSLRQALIDPAAPLSPTFATARQQPNPLGEYPTASGDLSGLFDAEWSYIVNHGTGVEELFRVFADGSESPNLATSSTEAPRLQAMRDSVAALRRRHAR